jgi:hypothetical protein
MLNKDNFQTSFTSVYLRKKVLHGLLIYKKKTIHLFFQRRLIPMMQTCLHRSLYIHTCLNFYCILPNSSEIKEF